MTGRASVVLAGSNQLLLIGVKQVLEASDRFKVVSQAHSGEVALALARRLEPDYVVLGETEQSHETNAGGAGIVDTVRGLVNLAKPPGVLVVAAPDQFRLVEELRRAGCRACVSTRSADTVLTAMDMLSAGREFFPEWSAPPPLEHAHRNSGTSALLKDLNRSEVEILALLARGYSSKKIAARVGLAAGTVNNYRATIRAKLGAGTHAEIRRAARAAGLLDPPDGHGAGGDGGRGSTSEHGEQAVR